MNRDDILATIGRLDWTFAKTMPEQPHEYTIKRDNEVDFALLWAAITAHGYWQRWQGRRYRNLKPGDGWRYWIMGGRQSFIINRAREVPEDR